MGFFKKLFKNEKSLEVSISDHIYKLLKGELMVYGRSKRDLPTRFSNSNRSLGIICGMILGSIETYEVEETEKHKLLINCIHRVFVSVFGFKRGTLNFKGVKDVFNNNKLNSFPEFKKGINIGIEDYRMFILSKHNIPSEWVEYIFEIEIGPDGLSKR